MGIFRAGSIIRANLDEVGGVMSRELQVRKPVPAGDPGVFQDLLGRVTLVGVHVQHV